MVEELNDWVMTIAGWITLGERLIALAKWLAPKIRKSLKKWLKRKRKR